MAGTDFAEVQRVLVDLDFPATKEQIVRHAEARDGGGRAVRMLRALPLATYLNISEIRSSVPLDEAADDGLTPSEEAVRARTKRLRIAEHLREPDSQ